VLADVAAAVERDIAHAARAWRGAPHAPGAGYRLVDLPVVGG
jgi:hypothetical protein